MLHNRAYSARERIADCMLQGGRRLPCLESERDEKSGERGEGRRMVIRARYIWMRPEESEYINICSSIVKGVTEQKLANYTHSLGSSVQMSGVYGR